MLVVSQIYLAIIVKTFFNIRGLRVSLHVIVVAVVLAAAFIGCAVYFWAMRATDRQPLRRVLCIHSYSEEFDYYRNVVPMLQKGFEQNGLNVKLHHLWLNSTSDAQLQMCQDLFAKIDMMEKDGEAPDLVLVNDDPALETITKYMPARFDNYPVVYAGVSHTMAPSDNMTGFVDEIDFVRNLEIVRSFSHSNIAIVELDRFDYDNQLRESLFSAIADTNRFLNNHNFDSDWANSKGLSSLSGGGKFVVFFVSEADPELNRKNCETDSVGYVNTRVLSREASTSMSILQVKCDVFSNSFINRSKRKQFTCINEQFADKNYCRFLCGYFASIETQIQDQVEYASQILKGASPSDLPPAVHHKACYMDYHAMVEEGLDYDDYKMEYQIVGAPFRVSQPWAWRAIVAGCVLLFLVIVIGVIQRVVWARTRVNELLLNRLRREQIKRHCALSASKAMLFSIRNNTIRFSSNFVDSTWSKRKKLSLREFRRTMIHPDYHNEFDLLTFVRVVDSPASQKNAVRLKACLDGSGVYHWYKVTYMTPSGDSDQNYVDGIFIDIDDVCANEDKLLAAREAAESVKLRESFLANISHDIRTPLGAIWGFANILSQQRKQLSEAEKVQIADIVQHNTSLLLKLVDEVVDQSCMTVGDFSLQPQICDVATLLRMIYETNVLVAPKNIDFQLAEGESNLRIFVDVKGFDQVVNNLLSNAFKYTHHGSVVLGWKFLSESNSVQIYVADTGIGIKPEDADRIFERFQVADVQAQNSIGLGLAICRDIINKLDGSISLESELGKGSCFRITFKNVELDVAANVSRKEVGKS